MNLKQMQTCSTIMTVGHKRFSHCHPKLGFLTFNFLFRNSDAQGVEGCLDTLPESTVRSRLFAIKQVS